MVISMKPFINADAEETKVLSRPKSLKKATCTIRAANLSIVNIPLSGQEFSNRSPIHKFKKIYIA